MIQNLWNVKPDEHKCDTGKSDKFRYDSLSTNRRITNISQLMSLVFCTCMLCWVHQHGVRCKDVISLVNDP